MGVKRSTISWLLAGILITGTVTLSTAEDITFQGTTKTKAGDFVMLSGKLTKPQGVALFLLS